MKSYQKILLYGLGFFVVAVLFFTILQGFLKQPGNNNAKNQNQENDTVELSDYILSTQEESTVKEFVKNFVNLYNSYSYKNFSNLTALGDYQTLEFQKKTAEFVAELENSVPSGFLQTTVSDLNTFKYSYQNLSLLTATLKAHVTEEIQNYNQVSPRSAQNTKQYLITVRIELIKSANVWLVNDIKIQK